MDVLLIVLLLLALYIVFFHNAKENMTNKDLLNTLNSFGKAKKVNNPSEEPIYGPKTSKAEPQPASSSSGGDDGNNVYPDIYGPEITPIPGKKSSKNPSKKPLPAGTHASDDHEDQTYEFNPDFKNAFPTDSDEPQPFLNDFSKFQH
jgi:hypothetical protein